MEDAEGKEWARGATAMTDLTGIRQALLEKVLDLTSAVFKESDDLRVLLTYQLNIEALVKTYWILEHENKMEQAALDYKARLLKEEQDRILIQESIQNI